MEGCLALAEYQGFRQEDLVPLDRLDYLGLVKTVPVVLTYPFLFVSTRSGGLFMLVRGKGDEQRLTGSIIGELTFRSLLLRAGVTSCKQAVTEAMEAGSASNVDLLVKDIYGDSSIKVGLPENLVASSLAKLAREKCHHETRDIVKSLSISMAINFAQLASYSAQLSKASAIVFASEVFDEPRWQLAAASLIWQHCKLPTLFPQHARNLVQFGYLLL